MARPKNPTPLEKEQELMRERWADKKYAKQHGTVTKELRERFNQEFPNNLWGDEPNDK